MQVTVLFLHLAHTAHDRSVFSLLRIQIAWWTVYYATNKHVQLFQTNYYGSCSVVVENVGSHAMGHAMNCLSEAVRPWSCRPTWPVALCTDRRPPQWSGGWVGTMNLHTKIPCKYVSLKVCRRHHRTSLDTAPASIQLTSVKVFLHAPSLRVSSCRRLMS
jgi:hypothetical protein